MKVFCAVLFFTFLLVGMRFMFTTWVPSNAVPHDMQFSVIIACMSFMGAGMFLAVMLATLKGDKPR